VAKPLKIEQASLLKWGLALLTFALDCASPPNLIFPVFYPVLLFVEKQPNLYRIWIFALACMVLTLVSPTISAPPLPGDPYWIFWSNRLLVLIAIPIAGLLAQQRDDHSN
jgi:hypothetical protein